ncbi:hypothetical protein [Amycolatopsis sp. NPDC051903]|uniref:hypothetical protein n=1 Tax=Amycolatopsis sp. NPDC051903 TaxID=3363936 RepID=UPI0037B0297E
MTEPTRVWEPGCHLAGAPLPPNGVPYAVSQRRLTRRLATRTALTLVGIALFFAGLGIAVPIFVLFFGVPYLVTWAYAAAREPRSLPDPDAPFEEVHCEPDGLVARRRTIGVRLPDGRWLTATVGLSVHAQLAGQRRLWLIRAGDQAWVAFPGIAQRWRGRIEDAPPAGAEPMPVLSRALGSPREDPVQLAGRRARARASWRNSALQAVAVTLAAWAVWGLAERVHAREIDQILGLAVALVVGVSAAPALSFVLLSGIEAFLYRKPRRAAAWTPVRVLDRKIVFHSGTASVLGRAQLPDGRVVSFRLPKATVSLALNVVVSGQLWTFGKTRGTAQVGVPGYPLLGFVKFSRREQRTQQPASVTPSASQPTSG